MTTEPRPAAPAPTLRDLARRPADAPPRTPSADEVAAMLPPAQPFRPFSGRRRLLIGACGSATAVLILGSMLLIDTERLRAQWALQWADAPLCEAGQTEDCVGGLTEVTVLPAASAPGR